jgi:hypothetical protein
MTQGAHEPLPGDLPDDAVIPPDRIRTARFVMHTDCQCLGSDRRADPTCRHCSGSGSRPIAVTFERILELALASLGLNNAIAINQGRDEPSP